MMTRLTINKRKLKTTTCLFCPSKSFGSKFCLFVCDYQFWRTSKFDKQKEDTKTWLFRIISEDWIILSPDVILHILLNNRRNFCCFVCLFFCFLFFVFCNFEANWVCVTNFGFCWKWNWIWFPKLQTKSCFCVSRRRIESKICYFVATQAVNWIYILI